LKRPSRRAVQSCRCKRSRRECASRAGPASTVSLSGGMIIMTNSRAGVKSSASGWCKPSSNGAVPKGPDWNQLETQILEATDVTSVYRDDLGIDVVGAAPNENGWLSCRGRRSSGVDSDPSAAICTTGPARGRYKDKGTGDSYNLWEAAAKFA